MLYEVCECCEENVEKLQQCGVCKIVKYCSRKCQIADWKLKHKVLCKSILSKLNGSHPKKYYLRCIESLSVLLKKKKLKNNAYLLFYRGQFYEKIGRKSDALKDYGEAVDIKPENFTFSYRRLILCFQVKDEKLGVRCYESLKIFFPEYIIHPHLEELYKINKILMLTDIIERNVLRGCVGCEIVGIRDRAVFFSENGEASKAIEDFNSVIDLFGDLDTSKYQNCHTGGKFNERKDVDYFRDIEFRSFIGRGSLYSNELGENDKAIEDFNHAIEIAPSNYWGYFNRGVAYWRNRECVKAMNDLKIASDLDPTNTDIFFNMALFWDGNKNTEADTVIENISKAIELGRQQKLGSKVSKYLIFRGKFYRERKEFEKAMVDFNEFIEENPDDESGYSERGLLYREQGEIEKSIRDYRKSCDLEPEFANSFDILAELYEYQGRYPEAIECYSRSIKLHPAVQKYCYLARTYLWFGKRKLSGHWYQKALDDFPDEKQYVFHSRFRSANLTMQDDFEKSIEDFSFVKMLRDKKSSTDDGEELERFEDWIISLHNNIKVRERKEYTKADLTFRKYAENIFDLEKQESEYLKKIIENKEFEDFDFHHFLGGGAFGRTYSCEVGGVIGVFVVKVLVVNDDDLIGELLKKEIPNLPYHPNCISIINNLEHSQLIQEIDLTKFPDFENYWKFTRYNSGSAQSVAKFPVILMKYYRRDLKKFLEQRKRLNYRFTNIELFSMLRGLLKGTNHLHSHGLVHRDLHGGNIFVDPFYGRIWIGDYGCSLDTENTSFGFLVDKSSDRLFLETSQKNTANRNLGGCEDIQPPEIRNYVSKRDGDFLNYDKYDLFSIGVVIKWLLGYSKKDESDEEILQKNKIQELIRLLLEKDPGARIGFEDSIRAIEEMESLFPSELEIVEDEEKTHIFRNPISSSSEEEDSSEFSEEEENEGEDQFLRTIPILTPTPTEDPLSSSMMSPDLFQLETRKIKEMAMGKDKKDDKKIEYGVRDLKRLFKKLRNVSYSKNRHKYPVYYVNMLFSPKSTETVSMCQDRFEMIISNLVKKSFSIPGFLNGKCKEFEKLNDRQSEFNFRQRVFIQIYVNIRAGCPKRNEEYMWKLKIGMTKILGRLKLKENVVLSDENVFWDKNEEIKKITERILQREKEQKKFVYNTKVSKSSKNKKKKKRKKKVELSEEEKLERRRVELLVKMKGLSVPYRNLRQRLYKSENCKKDEFPKLLQKCFRISESLKNNECGSQPPVYFILLDDDFDERFCYCASNLERFPLTGILYQYDDVLQTHAEKNFRKRVKEGTSKVDYWVCFPLIGSIGYSAPHNEIPLIQLGVYLDMKFREKCNELIPLSVYFPEPSLMIKMSKDMYQSNLVNFNQEHPDNQRAESMYFIRSIQEYYKSVGIKIQNENVMFRPDISTVTDTSRFRNPPTYIPDPKKKSFLRGFINSPSIIDSENLSDLNFETMKLMDQNHLKYFMAGTQIPEQLDLISKFSVISFSKDGEVVSEFRTSETFFSGERDKLKFKTMLSWLVISVFELMSFDFGDLSLEWKCPEMKHEGVYVYNPRKYGEYGISEIFGRKNSACLSFLIQKNSKKLSCWVHPKKQADKVLFPLREVYKSSEQIEYKKKKCELQEKYRKLWSAEKLFLEDQKKEEEEEKEGEEEEEEEQKNKNEWKKVEKGVKVKYFRIFREKQQEYVEKNIGMEKPKDEMVKMVLDEDVSEIIVNTARQCSERVREVFVDLLKKMRENRLEISCKTTQGDFSYEYVMKTMSRKISAKKGTDTETEEEEENEGEE